MSSPVCADSLEEQPEGTGRKGALMSSTYTSILDNFAVSAPRRDKSSLRARLCGRIIQDRPIEAELRAAMREREGGEPTANASA